MNKKLESFYKCQGKFYVDPTIKKIPKNSLRLVNRLPAITLKKINKNTVIAKERIFIFLNEFHHGHLLHQANDLKFEAIDIHSKILIRIFGSRKYKIALEILYDNNILVRPESVSYKVGVFSNSYLLANSMIEKPFIKYLLTSETLRKSEVNLSRAQRRIIMKNPIARSYVLASFNTILPTEDELLAYAASKISQGYANKGKLLSWEKDRRKNEIKVEKMIEQGVPKEDLPRFTYVEDGIRRFKSLTEDKFMLPKIGGLKSGGRVTTSFTLMPKWIRTTLRLKNSKIVGVDYSALHPNIASALWGTGEVVTHQEVADYLGIPVLDAKIEHLKFFNTTVVGMEKMTVHKYYEDKQPQLLINVKATKEETYKRTSSIMFKAEVELMTAVILKLEDLGLSDSIIYVYDEIMTTLENAKKVQKVMMEVARDKNYNLIAKIG